MDGIGRVMPVEADNGGDVAPARGRGRDSLLLSAKLQLAGEPTVHEVRVRNLSEGGLMAELNALVAQGTAVQLELRGLGSIAGTVAWCTRGRIGIALNEPIDPQRARKPVGTGARTPGYVKPVLVARGPRR